MNGLHESDAGVLLRGVGKRYGAVTAVKPLDLTIRPGSLVTLLGPSGCGKTTLLRMIAGLERVSEGRVFINGQDVTPLSAGERNVSMVFQSYALFPHMNVRENVAYGLLSVSGTAKADAYARAEETLATVGLAGYGDRLTSEMSGGQQQRVAVARALVLRPDVLLFDEPLSNLDARLRRSMRDEIRSLQMKLGLTVVYVTHDQSEAIAVSDQIVVMRNAEIAQVGTPRELYEAPGNRFVATFMGEASELRGEMTGPPGGQASVQLQGLSLTLPRHGLGNGVVGVMVRPESVLLSSPGEPGALQGTVATATYMGSHCEYTLDTEAGQLFAIVRETGTLRAAGQAVGIKFIEHGVYAVAP
ncbi:MAG: ABC transporter ATP-binding protein [Ramlibacter sp.]|nr:ABC transporter ATP-binding protein [Ramlibacter sp.]